MRSKSVSMKVPWPLEDEMERVCHDEGYANMNACRIGAFIEKCQNNRRYRYVRAIANANPKDQSFLLERLFSFPLYDTKEMMKYFQQLENK